MMDGVGDVSTPGWATSADARKWTLRRVFEQGNPGTCKNLPCSFWSHLHWISGWLPIEKLSSQEAPRRCTGCPYAVAHGEPRHSPGEPPQSRQFDVFGRRKAEDAETEKIITRNNMCLKRRRRHLPVLPYFLPFSPNIIDGYTRETRDFVDTL